MCHNESKKSAYPELNFLSDFIQDFSIAINIKISLFDPTYSFIQTCSTEIISIKDSVTLVDNNLQITKFLKKFRAGGVNELVCSNNRCSYFALALYNNNFLIGYAVFGPILKQSDQKIQKKENNFSPDPSQMVQAFSKKRIEHIFDLFMTSSKAIFLEKDAASNLFFSEICIDDKTNFANESLTENEPIQHALCYIKDNFHRPITLAETANQVYFSQCYFSKLFKKETGLSFVTYLNHVRIKKAEVLLLKSNRSICTISRSVGYSQTSYFCKIFRTINGLSPSQYRKNFTSKIEKVI